MEDKLDLDPESTMRHFIDVASHEEMFSPRCIRVSNLDRLHTYAGTIQTLIHRQERKAQTFVGQELVQTFHESGDVHRHDNVEVTDR